MKYFSQGMKLDELKKSFKAWAFKLHPDRGGNEEAFKEMCNEYEEAKKTVNFTGFKGYKDQTAAAADMGQFKDIIEQLMQFEGLIIEIVGSWIWCSGETYQAKETLKGLGFHWNRTRKCWQKAPDENGWKAHSKETNDEIKGRYGCTTFNGDGKGPKKLN